MPITVFLSYQSDSRSKVEAVRQALEANHITCWMDKRRLTSGDDFLQMIRQGLEKSHLLVLFLTEACEKSPYVTQEVLSAESLGLTILPVRLENYLPVSDPLNRVNRFQFLDAFDGPIENYIPTIVHAVRQKLSQDSYSGRSEERNSADLRTGSPVADIANLVYDAWIAGFLIPTITGLVVKEGHREGIDRPYTFFDPNGAALYSSTDGKSLPDLLKEATGKMVISGERGSGKTILMLQLIRDLLPITEDINQTRVPLYLNVGSWVDPRKEAKEQPKIRDWIRSRLMKEYHLHSKRAEALIDSKNLIYCFDGLDDIRESHYRDAENDDLHHPQSEVFQREVLEEFIEQLRDLISDEAQQVVIAGGIAIQTLVTERRLPFCTLEIKSWTHDDLLVYLDQRGIGALASFIEAHPEIEGRLIKSFSELQMLGTIYQEKEQARGLERRAADGIEGFFSAVYDIYLKVKYDRYASDVRSGRVSASPSRSKDKTAKITKGGSLPISLSEITRFAPSIASYISQPGQGEAFRLDTLQPYELPQRLQGLYRWYAGLLIGAGITLTAGLPVLACVALEHTLHGAAPRMTILHSLLAILGYVLVGVIAAIGYRFSTQWKFGIVIGIAFALGKGVASGCSFSVPGFTPGWDAGIHNGLTALVGGTPIFAAIFWQTREKPYQIAPIETWDPDTGKLIYWMLGAAGLGALFAIELGWARGLSYAFLLGIFAFERFGKKPKLAPVHVRPNQAIIYSFKNAVKSAFVVSLMVAATTGISYGLAYGSLEGSMDAVMALASFVSIFFFGGMPVVKHIALRNTLRHDHLVSGNLGLWLQLAVNIGLMKQVGGGYVFSSEDSRREYASRQKSKDPQGLGWGETRLGKDATTEDHAKEDHAKEDHAKTS